MNSLSRGNLIARVVSTVSPQKSTLRYNISRRPFITSQSTIFKTPSYHPSIRNIKTQSISNVSATHHTDIEESFIKKMFKKYNFLSISKSRLRHGGYFLYESVADKIDYAEFFREFNLSDTFFSWFLVTELHVWMLMVRTMAENEDGKIVRNNMIEAMWGDTSMRAKVLWKENPGGARTSVYEISEQFNCAIIGYDEGINGDDKVLAGAIWRRFFQSERNNPEDVEKLLVYIRKQICYLDKLPRDDILENPNIEWLPLNDP